MISTPTNLRRAGAVADDGPEYFNGRPRFGGQPEKVIFLELVATFFLLVPFIYKLWKHEWAEKYINIVLLVVGGILWLVPLIVEKSFRYRITKRRIHVEKGLLEKELVSLDLAAIESATLRQNFIDRFLNIGTIHIVTSDEDTPVLHLRGISNAPRVFDELQEHLSAVRRQVETPLPS